MRDQKMVFAFVLTANTAVLRQVLHQTNQLIKVKAAEICGSFA